MRDFFYLGRRFVRAYIVLFYNRKLPLADGPSRLGEERSRLRDRVRVGTGRSERVHQVRSRALAHRPASHAHCPCWRAPGAFREAPRARCPHSMMLSHQQSTLSHRVEEKIRFRNMAGCRFSGEDQASPSRASGGRRPRRDLASSLARGQADLLGRAGKVTRAAPVRAPSRWQVTRNRGRARLQRAGPCFRANRRVLLGVQGLCGSHRCARGCSCVRVCVLLMRDGATAHAFVRRFEMASQIQWQVIRGSAGRGA